MKFTFNWLKEFVTFKASPEKLAELLTMAGLEVESITPLQEPETNREDWLFEISVTPNRGDCLGITGLATEVSALTGGRVKSTTATYRSKISSIANRVTIAIRNPRLCPRYSARVVDEVQMGPSPAWMRFRLESCGIRSINNVVDVTNYVMLETGQPLHAFDLDRLPTRNIVIRPANDINKFTTLDGVERELAAEDLLICDGNVPIALAGVMGGTNSEVTTETRSILLESANFDPRSIRRTAKRLGLHSEASHRFERGVDPEGTLLALNRAVDLLASGARGIPVPGVADRYPGGPKPTTLLLREERVEEILGVRIGAQQAEKLLRSLGLKAQRQARSGRIKVVVPPRRRDLTREADLIEELARLHGYQRVPSTLPLLRSSGGRSDNHLGWERKTRSHLDGEGMVEGILDLLHMGEPMGWSREPSAFLHPGRAAALIRDDKKLGHLGQVHPDVSEELGVPPFLLFELDFEGLLQYAPRRITARSLPRFPSVERDFAIVVEGEFPSQQIVGWIKNRGEALIESVEVLDQYVGSSIPAGKKSLAYKISYRADDRTLTDTEINTLHQNLVEQIAKFFGAQVR